MKMNLSKEGVELIKRFEGLRLKAYKCQAGIWTIGYGHTKGVREGQTITTDKAEDLLMQDIIPVENVINKMGVEMTQIQFDSLVSFVFNIGSGKFFASTLYCRIQIGASKEQIAKLMLKWIYVKGAKSRGLMNRRVAEANMYLGSVKYKVMMDKIVLA